MSKDLSEEQWARIETALFARRKIEAIKLFCEFTGASLKEAKEAMEAHQKTLEEQSPEKFTAAKGAGCTVTTGLFVVTAGLLAWWCL